MTCWCNELNTVSGYMCFDCNEKMKLKRLTKIEKSTLKLYDKFLQQDDIDLREFEEKFFEVEEIRKKIEEPRGSDCPCRRQDVIWRITCRECDTETRWDNISEEDQERLDKFRSLILGPDPKGLVEMINEERAKRHIAK
jgi:hypothetical protein